jgi:hypothetical protein
MKSVEPFNRLIVKPGAGSATGVRFNDSTIQRFNGLIFLLCTILLVGCQAPNICSNASRATAYRPDNLFRPALPPNIRRVAVLPLAIDETDWQADAGRLELEPVFRSELAKVKAFELTMVTPEQLKELADWSYWTGDERLPMNFFSKLQETFGCDAVLFSQLRPHHAYKPMVVGWRFKLVDVQNHAVIWAADEVFDASDRAVARAAEQYWENRSDGIRPSVDREGVLISPRRFSQYTLCALFETLPGGK